MKNYFNFYKDCLENNYIDFSDNYQRQKIQLLAKKHGLVFSSTEFSEHDFLIAQQEYKEYLTKQERKKQEELDLQHEEYVKELRTEEASILDVVKKYSEKKGRDKITAMCNEIISKNQQIVKKIDKKINQEYRAKRERIIPSAIVGGTIEGLTGSRLAGIYNAVNNESVNDAKRARNRDIALEIGVKYSSEYRPAKELVTSAEAVLKRTEMSYIETDMLLAKYLDFKEIKMFISETGALRVYANLTTKKIIGLPNDINAYIDGTMKALIYKTGTNEVVDEILLTLGYEGIGKDTIVEGVSPNTMITAETIDAYNCVIVDYNLFAVEYKYADHSNSIPVNFSEEVPIGYYYNIAKKAYESGTIQGYKKALKYANYVNNDNKAAELEKKAKKKISEYYYNVALESLNTNEVVKVESAIKSLRYVDESTEKESLNTQLHEHLIETKRLAEEIKIADEKAAVVYAEENKKKKKKLTLIITPIAVITVVLIAVYMLVIVPGNHLKQGDEYMKQGRIDEAIREYEQSSGNEATNKLLEAKYAKAEKEYNTYNYESAEELYNNIEYLDSRIKAELCKVHIMIDANKPETAYQLLTKLDKTHPDVNTLLGEFVYLPASVTFANGSTVSFKYDKDGKMTEGPFSMYSEFDDSGRVSRAKIEWYYNAYITKEIVDFSYSEKEMIIGANNQEKIYFDKYGNFIKKESNGVISMAKEYTLDEHNNPLNMKYNKYQKYYYYANKYGEYGITNVGSSIVKYKVIHITNPESLNINWINFRILSGMWLWGLYS